MVSVRGGGHWMPLMVTVLLPFAAPNILRSTRERVKRCMRNACARKERKKKELLSKYGSADDAAYAVELRMFDHAERMVAINGRRSDELLSEVST